MTPATPPQRWRCHACRQTVTTYVELVEPPTCHGGWRHRPTPMYPDNDNGGTECP